MTDPVCVGEAMGQFVPANSDIRSATSFVLNHAGAESNTAITIERLGFDVERFSGHGAPRAAVSIAATVTTIVSALPVRVVESVGAGDSFAAGWLVGLLRGYSDTTCLRFGHLVARQALESMTDQGGSANFEEIIHWAQTEPNWAMKNAVNKEHRPPC